MLQDVIVPYHKAQPNLAPNHGLSRRGNPRGSGPALYAGLRPQTYESGLEPSASPHSEQVVPAPPLSPGARALAGGARGNTAPEFKLAAPPESVSTDQPLDPTASVIAAAAAGEVGELFRYSVGHVSVPR
jgi:hypothetical protein